MDYRLAHIDSLFPTPLLRFRVDGHEALNTALLAEIAERRAVEPGIERTNRKGWHSTTDLFDRREPAQARLCAMVREIVIDATRRMAPKTALDSLVLHCDGWINASPTGGYNAPHAHAGSFWSGVYYVAVPGGTEDGGEIDFIAPQHLHSPGGLIQAPMTAGKVRFRPAAGTLLLFPATLTHFVHPNHAAAERVTVAFNAWFSAQPQLAANP